MAGDWIPLRIDVYDDPAVIAIAAATGIDEFGIVGRLGKLWGWANRHLAAGNAPRVTAAWIDRYTATPGFAAAMLDAGWLRARSDGVEFPNFDRWNSQGAKRRILTARRVAGHKAKGNATGNAPGNAPGVSGALPKEEKRREGREEKTPPTPRKRGEGSEPLPPIPLELDTPAFRLAWGEWVAERRAKRNAVTPRAAALAFASLAKVGSERACECIRESIERGWTGLFPDRSGGKPAGGLFDRGAAQDQRILTDIIEGALHK